MWLGFTSSFQKPFTAIPRKVLNFLAPNECRSCLESRSHVRSTVEMISWMCPFCDPDTPTQTGHMQEKQYRNWPDSLHSSPRQRTRHTLRNLISSIRIAARSSWAKMRYGARLCWSDSEQKITGSFATFFFFRFGILFSVSRISFLLRVDCSDSRSAMQTVNCNSWREKWARLGNAFVVIIHLQFTWCGFSIH